MSNHTEWADLTDQPLAVVFNRATTDRPPEWIVATDNVAFYTADRAVLRQRLLDAVAELDELASH